MKKTIALLLVLVLALRHAGRCGGSNDTAEAPAADSGETAETPAAEISVAAIETAYGSEMWQQVAEAFTAETGIKVNLTTDKNLEDVIGPAMQGGEFPDVIPWPPAVKAGLTEQFIKDNNIADITDVLSMTVPGEDVTVADKIAGGFTETSLTNPYGDGKDLSGTHVLLSLRTVLQTPASLLKRAGKFPPPGTRCGSWGTRPWRRASTSSPTPPPVILTPSCTL